MTDQQSLERLAAEICLSRNIPFVIYSLPGGTATRFYASLPDAEGCSRVSADDSGDCFFISRFGPTSRMWPVSGVTCRPKT